MKSEDKRCLRVPNPAKRNILKEKIIAQTLKIIVSFSNNIFDIFLFPFMVFLNILPTILSQKLILVHQQVIVSEQNFKEKRKITNQRKIKQRLISKKTPRAMKIKVIKEDKFP